MIFSAKMADDDKYQCKNVIRDKRFNVCQLVKAVSSSILLAPVVKKLMEAASFELSCPFKIGNYFVRNMNFHVPSYLPFPSGFYCIDVNFVGKSKSLKKMEKFMALILKAQLQ